jgi:hypothetical protein
LQLVLELRCYKHVLPDEELENAYFKSIWKFHSDDFELRGWQSAPLCWIKAVVEDFDDVELDEAHLESLVTKEQVIQASCGLVHAPWYVCKAARHGLAVLSQLRTQEGFAELRYDPDLASLHLRWACEAALDEFAVDERILPDDEYALPRPWGGGPPNVVDFLLSETDADKESRDEEGRTVLHIAAKRGHLKTVKLLVGKHGVDVDARDLDDMNAVHAAMDAEHADVLEYLLSFEEEDREEEIWPGKYNTGTDSEEEYWW